MPVSLFPRLQAIADGRPAVLHLAIRADRHSGADFADISLASISASVHASLLPLLPPGDTAIPERHVVVNQHLLRSKERLYYIVSITCATKQQRDSLSSAISAQGALSVPLARWPGALASVCRTGMPETAQFFVTVHIPDQDAWDASIAYGFLGSLPGVKVIWTTKVLPLGHAPPTVPTVDKDFSGGLAPPTLPNSIRGRGASYVALLEGGHEAISQAAFGVITSDANRADVTIRIQRTFADLGKSAPAAPAASAGARGPAWGGSGDTAATIIRHVAGSVAEGLTRTDPTPGKASGSAPSLSGLKRPSHPSAATVAPAATTDLVVPAASAAPVVPAASASPVVPAASASPVAPAAPDAQAVPTARAALVVPAAQAAMVVPAAQAALAAPAAQASMEKEMMADLGTTVESVVRSHSLTSKPAGCLVTSNNTIASKGNPAAGKKKKIISALAAVDFEESIRRSLKQGSKNVATADAAAAQKITHELWQAAQEIKKAAADKVAAEKSAADAAATTAAAETPNASASPDDVVMRAADQCGTKRAAVSEVNDVAHKHAPLPVAGAGPLPPNA